MKSHWFKILLLKTSDWLSLHHTDQQCRQVFVAEHMSNHSWLGHGAFLYGIVGLGLVELAATMKEI